MQRTYMNGFVPYALAAFLVGIVGGFSTVLGPAFVRDIGIAYGNTTWTALSQAISTAAFAPVLGRLGDIFGRRLTLLLGMAVFTAGNVLSALSGSLPMMLLARFVVGLGTAAIAPVIMAYIVTEFPADAVAKGFSVYMLISSASVIAGPALGGMIVASLGWRAMLWVCVGICACVLAVCMTIAAPQDWHRAGSMQIDGAGAVLVPVFFALLLCIPAFGQNFGWASGRFLLVLTGAAASLSALVWVESRAAQPILPGSFMARRTFVLTVIALFLTQGLMQANMTNTIVFVNSTQPANGVISGYAISVMYLGMSLGAVLLGPLADRHEPRGVLTASLLLTAAGCAMLLLYSVQTPLFMLMLSLGLLGLGLGGNGTIFMKVALSGLPAERAGAGTGTYGLFRDLAAPFGVAVFVPMFTNAITRHAAAGMAEAQAAVDAIRSLSVMELVCIAGGLIAVRLLPRIHSGGAEGPGTKHTAADETA